jgi:hypothetical protein
MCLMPSLLISTIRHVGDEVVKHLEACSVAIILRRRSHTVHLYIGVYFFGILMNVPSLPQYADGTFRDKSNDG